MRSRWGLLSKLMSDFCQDTPRTALKPYRCEWCFEPIPPGMRHAYSTGRWEGEFFAYRLHDECHAARDSGEIRSADGWSPGMFKRGTTEEQ